VCSSDLDEDDGDAAEVAKDDDDGDFAGSDDEDNEAAGGRMKSPVKASKT
jgi:hypothetical protein